MSFNNNTIELREVGGSFEAIADTMDVLIEDSERLAAEQNYKYPILIYKSPQIELVQLISTRGFQICPFNESFANLQCKETSSSDYIIRNAGTGRKLWINQMTSHLAREHNLLEKDNEYGIGAREFYEHFMPAQDTKLLLPADGSQEVSAELGPYRITVQANTILKLFKV
jgi:hypothetical protein